MTITADSDVLGLHEGYPQPAFLAGLNQSGRLSEEHLERQAYREIIVCLAGAEAEKRAGAPKAAVARGAALDQELAVDFASRVTGSAEEVEALLNWLAVRTRNLIEHHWHCVEAQRRRRSYGVHRTPLTPRSVLLRPTRCSPGPLLAHFLREAYRGPHLQLLKASAENAIR